MTKATEVKRMAAQALQSATDSPPVEEAMLPKAPRCLPAKARAMRLEAAAAKALPLELLRHVAWLHKRVREERDWLAWSLACDWMEQLEEEPLAEEWNEHWYGR